MTVKQYFDFLTKEIHTVIAATVNDDNHPATCAIDIMDYDDAGLYFLTAKGKGFYSRLIKTGYIALTGIRGEDTMSRVALSVHGKVKDIGTERLKKLFVKNSYMNDIYPTVQSREALTVFILYEGSGEWFDLSKKPIERDSFSFGDAKDAIDGYFITDNCIGCGKCKAVCPQGCIAFSDGKAAIEQNHCLHCGNCLNVCEYNAIIRTEGRK